MAIRVMALPNGPVMNCAMELSRPSPGRVAWYKSRWMVANACCETSWTEFMSLDSFRSLSLSWIIGGTLVVVLTSNFILHKTIELWFLTCMFHLFHHLLSVLY